MKYVVFSFSMIMEAIGKINRKQITIFCLGTIMFFSTGICGAQTSSNSWLPSDKEATANPEIEKVLKSLDGRFRILGCRYDASFLERKQLIVPGKPEVSDGWDYKLKAVPVKGEKNALDLYMTFSRGSEQQACGIGVAFDFYNWNSQNYVMIPASVYDGNRNRIVNRNYAEGLDRSDLYRKDLPRTTTPLPQLSPNAGDRSRLDVITCNTTTPAICLFDRRKETGLIVLSEQGIRYQGGIVDHGFTIEENADRTVASMVISVPGVREKKPEFVGFSKSPDRGISWKAGDEHTVRLRVYQFSAADIAVFLDKFMTVRKEVTGPNSPRNLVPFSEIARLMCGNIDKRFYSGNQFRFYCPENANWISYGWVGGLMNTFPMLALDDEKHRCKVGETFDFGLTLGQGESGYYYGALNYDGKPFGREGYDEMPEIVLTRKNADLLFWMIKQFMLLKAQGHAGAIRPDWEQRVKLLADAFVSTWKKHGTWGNFLNNKTGEVAVYGTSGGVMAIGGLALASQYYNHSDYLYVARQAADFYYKDFLETGMTTGACADILQNADSETAAGFMTALMALYETTGEKKWLERSRDLAGLCATWTVSFDYELPAETPLATLGAKLAGVVWASTQNKHGAPGFCTSSGDALFKIYRATGDKRFASLLYDVAHAYAEGIQPTGYITERLTYCDADARGTRGEGKTGWNETNGALMAMELPGIYLRTDIDRMVVFDHVKAEVLERDKSGITLKIANPTDYDALVSILAEDQAQAKKPLGYTSFTGWMKVPVKAGQSILWKIE